MSRNQLIGIAVAVLIILFMPAYYRWISPPAPTVPIDTTVAPDTVVAQPVDTAATPTVQPDTSVPRVDTAREWLQEDSAHVITVSTAKFDVVLTNLGATVISVKFKNYEYADGGGVELVWALKDFSAAQRTLGTPIQPAVTLHRTLVDPLTPDVNGMMWRVAYDSTRADGSRVVSFTLSDTSHVGVSKTFEFNRDRYDFSVVVRFDDPSRFGLERKWTLGWLPGVAPTEPNWKDDFGYFKSYARMGDELVDLGDFRNKTESLEGRTVWAGARSKYFLAAIIPDGEFETVGAELYNSSVAVRAGEQDVDARVSTIGVASAVGAREYRFKIYTGPIDSGVLRSYGVGLDEIVDFGWTLIRPVSVAVLWLLVALHDAVLNWGLAIILFTLIMKVILMPLSVKSTKSMAKMADLQPKIKALQAKHKDDQQRQSAELLKLYKTEGINPLGGCLPLVLQMPIFFALFTVFKSTISLRQAEFILWIRDLSLKDPYYVLPIVMGVTMFLSQRLSMRDPKQKMMVYMLPVVFTFLFKDMPAGLVLYWTMFNILNLFEYQFVRKRLIPPPTSSEAPVALPDPIEPARPKGTGKKRNK